MKKRNIIGVGAIYTFLDAKYNKSSKKIDDRTCLTNVYSKYVLFLFVSKVNNFSQISLTEGVTHWVEGEGVAYIYVRVED